MLSYREKIWEKKKVVLNLIKLNPDITRSRVKELSGLSMEMTLQYIDELIDDGYVFNSGSSRATVGRRATFLRLSPDGGRFFGIGINADTVCASVVDFTGGLLYNTFFPIECGADAERVLGIVRSAADVLFEKFGNGVPVRALGLGVPGFVDRGAGVGVKYARIPGWENIRFAETFGARYGVPVYVEHTIRTAAMEYRMRPENAELDDFVYLNAGYGIVMVIFVGGRPVDGFSNGAGEVGHMHYADNGILCHCGRYGCCETEGGRPAVLRKAAERMAAGRLPELKKLMTPGLPPSPALICEAAERGDTDAARLIRETAEVIGTVAAQSVAVINPRRLVLRGDFAGCASFVGEVKSVVGRLCFPESTRLLEFDTVTGDADRIGVYAAMTGYYRQFIPGGEG